MVRYRLEHKWLYLRKGKMPGIYQAEVRHLSHLLPGSLTWLGSLCRKDREVGWEQKDLEGTLDIKTRQPTRLSMFAWQ